MISVLPGTDADVTWFGASRRLVAGRPDTRYGWMNSAQGPCIVKALDLELAAYSATLLENERNVLEHLHAAGAPVPELVPTARTDWLVTRFSGLSHRVLTLDDDAASSYPFHERLAVWIHFLRQARDFDDAGALPIDLWGANLVLPLTQTTHGQLRLYKAVLIDHAHTVVVGMNLRRPVWLDRDMRRVPPELREALRDDQEALTAAYHVAGAPLPGHDDARPEALELSRRMWAEYDAPQRLQRTLDAGRLDRAAAIQYAVGIELERLLPLASAPAAVSLRAVLARMTAENVADRYPLLTDAAAALNSVHPLLAMVGHHHHGEVEPLNLIRPAKAVSEATARQETFVCLPADGEGLGSATTMLSPVRGPAVEVDTPATSRLLGMGFAYAAAAAGAVAGIVFPLPW